MCGANEMSLTLISHTLCPYVQRAAIVLAEKQVDFERRYVDLGNKPEWFRAISPLGKTPVLMVGDTAIFESAAICEYLDDTLAPRLHPVEPLERAKHRGWMEFGSALLNTIGAFYNAPDEAALHAKAGEIHSRFKQLEAVLGNGPYFEGDRFCIVDAVFGPIFRYFDVFDEISDFGCMKDLAKIQAWRAALRERVSVVHAVAPSYSGGLKSFLIARQSALSTRMSVQHKNAQTA
jgi:glutathione S-transferase